MGINKTAVRIMMLERGGRISMHSVAVLVLTACLVPVLTAHDCYNGPAPVVVNEDADIYIGNY